MREPEKEAVSFAIQNRDVALLIGLFESRVMTAAQIAVLYFGGKKEATKKRLQTLKAAGLIGERRRRVNEKSVLSLTRKGHALLQEKSLLASFPKLSPAVFEKRANVSDLTLRHELEVMEVKAAFHSALSKSAIFTISEFTTWPRLHEFKAGRGSAGEEVLVKPDGFIRIEEKEKDGGLSEHTFFLEVDRSSETQQTLVSRAGCYLDYYKSGGFAVRNGARRSEYKEYPFRVLIVLKNPERRNNTADRLIQNNPPILTMVYLSTFPTVLADPVGAVWIRPIDYRNAISATPFEATKQAGVYRRKPEREMLVEKKIKKTTLLEHQ